MSMIARSKPRKIQFEKEVNPHHKASVMASFGQTKIYITACVEENVPRWLKGKGQGWVTAEYSMLPGSTQDRVKRERRGAGGRTYEIQRLIGRSLRAVVDMRKLGERSIHLDCDVLVADGGTRTASISGAYIALKLAVKELLNKGLIEEDPVIEPLAAISIGIDKNKKIIADLNYEEDSQCQTDMNIVMTKSEKFIEIQGTAEGEPFSYLELTSLLECAKISLKEVFRMQDEILQ